MLHAAGHGSYIRGVASGLLCGKCSVTVKGSVLVVVLGELTLVVPHGWDKC